jgi:hypothetical protein
MSGMYSNPGLFGSLLQEAANITTDVTPTYRILEVIFISLVAMDFELSLFDFYDLNSTAPAALTNDSTFARSVSSFTWIAITK